MTNERPMLYSAPMVRGLLNDTKTQTRRLVKPQPKNERVGMVNAAYCGFPHTWLVDGAVSEYTCEDEKAPVWVCPYGKPGDRLWVREAWRTVAEADAIPPRDMDEAFRLWFEVEAPHQPGAGKYRPPMFMPRWASRITLEITEVRVERLQDISVADAIAEGIESEPGTAHWKNYDTSPGGWRYWESPIQSYRTLWNSINGPDAWDENPWVWAVSFKRLTGSTCPA